MKHTPGMKVSDLPKEESAPHPTAPVSAKLPPKNLTMRELLRNPVTTEDLLEPRE